MRPPAVTHVASPHIPPWVLEALIQAATLSPDTLQAVAAAHGVSPELLSALADAAARLPGPSAGPSTAAFHPRFPFPGAYQGISPPDTGDAAAADRMRRRLLAVASNAPLPSLPASVGANSDLGVVRAPKPPEHSGPTPAQLAVTELSTALKPFAQAQPHLEPII